MNEGIPRVSGDLVNPTGKKKHPENGYALAA
jgi:hypothetical protein